jgi:hypothetical protein
LAICITLTIHSRQVLFPLISFPWPQDFPEPKVLPTGRSANIFYIKISQLQYLRDLANAMINGRLPSRRTLRRGVLGFDTFNHYWNWNSANLPAKVFPQAGPSRKDFRNLNDRVAEILGSTTNRAVFRRLEKGLNGEKGRVFKTNPRGQRTNPVQNSRMRDFITSSIRNQRGEDRFLNPIRRVIGVWVLLHDGAVSPSVQRQRRLIEEQMRAAEQYVPRLVGILDGWREFDDDFWDSAVRWSRAWVNTWLDSAETEYTQANLSPRPPSNALRVLAEIRALRQQMQRIPSYPSITPPPTTTTAPGSSPTNSPWGSCSGPKDGD